MNMPSRQAQRDRPAERGGEAIRRPCAAHPHMQRLALRARGRRPELVCLLVDLRNREMVGVLGGSMQGYRSGEGGVRCARVTYIPSFLRGGAFEGLRFSPFLLLDFDTVGKNQNKHA